MRTAGARVENAYGLERARAGVTTLVSPCALDDRVIYIYI